MDIEETETTKKISRKEREQKRIDLITSQHSLELMHLTDGYEAELTKQERLYGEMLGSRMTIQDERDALRVKVQELEDRIAMTADDAKNSEMTGEERVAAKFGDDTEHEVVLAFKFFGEDELMEIREVIGWEYAEAHPMAHPEQYVVKTKMPDGHHQRYHVHAGSVQWVGVHVKGMPEEATPEGAMARIIRILREHGTGTVGMYTVDSEGNITPNEEAAEAVRAPLTEEDAAEFEAMLSGSVDPSKLWAKQDHPSQGPPADLTDEDDLSL